jgi:hypothetical protein
MAKLRVFVLYLLSTILQRISKRHTRALSTFLLVTFYLSPAFALPLQEPLPGVYKCFSSAEGPFETTVVDTGATLEFIDAQTYRFTTATASEEGTVSSSVIDTSGDVEGETAMTAIWQGGSNLVLEPRSGNTIYQGGFFVDYQGNRYTVIQNNNGLNIRCESEGADIAATFQRTANGDTNAAEPEETNETQEAVVAEREEDQLAPADVTAPPPPANAGGLSGLYINYDDSTGLSFSTSMDMNGNITWTPNLSYSAPQFIYFLENGYVYEGLYSWSFAELDCSRLLKDNTPLCNTYVIKDGTIQFSTDEPLAFLQGEGNTIRLGENVNDFWTKQEPLAVNTLLDGTWEYVTAGGFGGTGVDTLMLKQDGTFEWQYSGTVSYSTPDSLSDATGADVYVGGTSTTAKTGTYRIDGYTLELTRTDGVTEKVLFVLDYNDDGTPGNIWLGGATRYLKK